MRLALSKAERLLTAQGGLYSLRREYMLTPTGEYRSTLSELLKTFSAQPVAVEEWQRALRIAHVGEMRDLTAVAEDDTVWTVLMNDLLLQPRTCVLVAHLKKWRSNNLGVPIAPRPISSAKADVTISLDGFEYVLEYLSNGDLVVDEKSAFGDMNEYAVHKTELFPGADLQVIIGATLRMLFELARVIGWGELGLVHDGTLKRDFNKLRMLVFKRNDGKCIALVPPGKDIVRLYAQAYMLRYPNFRDQVQVCFFPGLMIPERFLKWSQLENLREYVVGGVVVLGASKQMFDLVKGFHRQNRFWTKESTIEAGEWVCFMLQSDDRRSLFLETRSLSFFGNMAETVGSSLFSMGAEEILHCGVKVGTKIDPGHVYGELFAPGTFHLLSQDGTLESLGINNTLAEFTGSSKSGAHVTVSSPFDESHLLVRGADIKVGIVSMDCEGAYFARSAAEHGQKFGAMYFASDYIRAVHEDFLLGHSLSCVSDEAKKELLTECGKDLGVYLRNRNSGFTVENLRQRLLVFYQNDRLTIFRPGEHSLKYVQDLFVLTKLRSRENADARPGPRPYLRKDDMLSVSDLMDSINANKTVIVQGPAGMGKTTLLKYMASLQMSKGRWKIVVFVNLKMFAQESDFSFRSFFRKAVPVSWETVKSACHSIEKDYCAVLWLLDGYDEVEGTENEAFRRFLAAVRANQVDFMPYRIVGTRPERNFAFDDAMLVELCLWNETNQEEYVTKFFSGKGEDKYLEDAKSLLFENEAARDLAGIPLICELICTLCKEKGMGSSLSSLSKLYEVLCEWLMKRNNFKEFGKILDYSVKAIQSTGVIELDIGDEGLLRSGFLRKLDKSSCTFIHQTLMEYCCARKLAQQESYALLESLVTLEPSQRVFLIFLSELLQKKGWSFFCRTMVEALKIRVANHSMIGAALSERGKAVAIDLSVSTIASNEDIYRLCASDFEFRSILCEILGLKVLIECVSVLGESASEWVYNALFFTSPGASTMLLLCCNPSAFHGNMIFLKRIVDRGLEQKVLDSMLQSAASSGKHVAAELLIDSGARREVINVKSAASHGHISLLKMLLRKGGDVNDGMTGALEGGRHTLIKYLVERWKGDVNLLVGESKVPLLQVFAESGNVAMLKFLRENGATVENVNLFDVAEHGNVEAVLYLMDEGANGHVLCLCTPRKGHLIL
jgi:energy-coupling factor transporter ATP-binding protein EcfA2